MKVREIIKWVDVVPPVYLCSLPFGFSYIEEQLEMIPRVVEEDGLGLLLSLYLEIDGHEFLLRAPKSGGYELNDGDEFNIFIYIKGGQPDLIEHLTIVRNLFEIEFSDFEEVNPDIKINGVRLNYP